MEIILTNREMLALYEAAKAAAGIKASLKFGFALARNLGCLEKDCEALRGQIQKRRQALIDGLACKDEAGQPVIVDGHYQFTPENRQTFEANILALQQEADELLASLVIVDLHRINLEHFPAELEPWILKGLIPVIEE